MKKAVKVNYPKKKRKLKLEDLGIALEPERHSLYQILLENLKIAKRVTFLHRIIYVGSHVFTSYDEAKFLFGDIVKTCNETYCLEKLSGFLLYYPQFVVHMVEGDEDNLNKHLRYVLDKQAFHASLLGTFKLLIQVANINQRFVDDWYSITGVPSKLLEKLDINADLQSSGRHIYNCIKKVYALVRASSYMCNRDSSNTPSVSQDKKAEIASNQSFSDATFISSDDDLVKTRFFGLSSMATLEEASMLEINLEKRSSIQLAKSHKLLLPEYELLDFIVNSNFTIKLQTYFDLYGVVPMRDIYKDKVWPVPHDFIPYDTFEKPFDCVTELPKEGKTKASIMKMSSMMNVAAEHYSEADTIQEMAGSSQV